MNDNDLVVMTHAKHEALRKDIEDYKLLLVKYQSLRIEQEVLVADLERQSKLLNNKSDVLEEFRLKNEQLLRDIDALRLKIEQQSVENAELNKAYNAVKVNYYIEKGKVYRMQKGQAQLYVWEGLAIFFFLAMLIVGAQN